MFQEKNTSEQIRRFPANITIEALKLQAFLRVKSYRAKVFSARYY